MLEDRVDYFIYAYESPNFSAAAAKVPMSPQGFSKAIRNLEKQLGVTLFTTDANGQRTPTPYADLYYEFAKNLQRERSQLQQSFDELTEHGALDFQIPTSLGVSGLIEERLKILFRQRCPEARLTLIEMPDAECERFIEEGTYQTGLLVSPARGDLVFRELYATSVCLWVHQSNPLFEREELSLEDLAGQTIAMPGHGFKCYTRLMTRMADAGLPAPQVIERSEIMWIYQEAAEGRALGFTLPYMGKLAAFSHHDAIRAIPVEGSRWGFGVVHNKEPLEGSYGALLEACALACSKELPT